MEIAGSNKRQGMIMYVEGRVGRKTQKQKRSIDWGQKSESQRAKFLEEVCAGNNG
jgi:hypothetical protein